MSDTLGRHDGFVPKANVDENGKSYGVKHTSNVPHSLLVAGTSTIGKVYITDGTRDASIDNTTHTFQTIDYAHHEIHSGSHYYIEGYTTLDDGDPVPETGILRVKLVTPDNATWAHFQWSIASTGILTTTLHEGASGGMGGGGPVTPLNNNRNSENNSVLTITSGVEVATTPGTLISNAKWGASGFKTTIGGGTARDDEIILKQGTTYVRTFTSDVDDNILQFKASWYEHQNKS